jgi:hypothetical protein
VCCCSSQQTQVRHGGTRCAVLRCDVACRAVLCHRVCRVLCCCLACVPCRHIVQLISWHVSGRHVAPPCICPVSVVVLTHFVVLTHGVHTCTAVLHYTRACAAVCVLSWLASDFSVAACVTHVTAFSHVCCLCVLGLGPCAAADCVRLDIWCKQQGCVSPHLTLCCVMCWCLNTAPPPPPVCVLLPQTLCVLRSGASSRAV